MDILRFLKMKDKNWNDCIKNKSCIKTSFNDINKIESLIGIAKSRNNFLFGLEITENNSNFIFEGLYSSLIELLHAIILKSNYKVNNHICLGFYIRDVLNDNSLFRKFDDCRYKRNSLIYYGNKMFFEVAIESIDLIKDLLKELENKVE